MTINERIVNVGIAASSFGTGLGLVLSDKELGLIDYSNFTFPLTNYFMMKSFFPKFNGYILGPIVFAASSAIDSFWVSGLYNPDHIAAYASSTAAAFAIDKMVRRNTTNIE